MKLTNLKRQLLSALFSIVFLTVSIAAQTSEFTYQGKLTATGTPSATYDFDIRLCDSAANCTVPLASQQIASVPVSNGVFTVKLTFNAALFNGDDRWLEIAVKRPAEGNFTTLDPRQKITSAPYAIKSRTADTSTTAANATNADSATNSVLFGGLTTNDFVQNTTTQQTGNFNLSGNGTLGGILAANEIKAQTGTGFYGLMHTDGTTTVSTYIGGSSSGATGAWFGTRSNSPLFFYTNSGQPQITILQNGNVGIGTATPAAKLDVAGNIGTNGSVNAAGNIFTSGFLSAGNGAGITGGLSVSNGINVSNGLNVNSGTLFVAGATTLNNGLTLTGDANVSGKITTNSLRVNSGGFSFATIGGNYGQDICRDTTFGTLGQCGLSSRRFKADVQTFSGGLNLVNRLRPVTFNWKHNGQPDFGFIAEEVLQVDPLLVTTNDAGELEGVKYKMFSVVLVDAVKAQQAQIDRQQNQIERQQRQIDALTRLVCSQSQQAEICK